MHGDLMTLLLQAASVDYSHGGRHVFDTVSFEIKQGDRLALIGPNGAGKSTLFRLMALELKPDSGVVTHRRGLRVGYLHQETVIDPEMTVRETVALAAGDPAALEQRLSWLELQMAEPLTDDELTAVMDEYSELLVRIEEVLDSRNPLPGAEILDGLRIPEEQWDQPLGALSGGEKKIVALAGLLAEGPDVLLLDEPDNHLDLAAKQWLESILATYDGAVATITHDRYFIDRISNRIFELADGKIVTYPGNYSTFVAEKRRHLERAADLRELQEREFKKLKASAEQLTQWARQNPTFAPRAENLRRKVAEERARLEATPVPRLDRRSADFSFEAGRAATLVVEAKGVAKSYGDRTLLRPFDLSIRHGERVGLVGPNGAGKTTLVRMILGQEPVSQGSIRIGPAIECGYYAQEQETLPSDQTALDYVRHLKAFNEQQAISFLNTLQLDRTAALSTIGQLSGGERARIQIGGLILTGANFLILDEPTNNLDLPSVEVLEEALLDFEGTILTISHDRYFLDRICNRTIELANGEVRDYPGGYHYYEEYRAKGTPLTLDLQSGPAAQIPSRSGKKSRS
jgi:ATP-binding cassette, subfamily F, member 3